MRLFTSFICVVFLLAVPVFVFAAVTVSFSNFPSTIDEVQEVELDVSLACTSCDDSYIRGVFFPSGSNYFGFTQNNGGEWINASGSSGCTQYFKITADQLTEGSWSGKIKVKIDKENSHYDGPGSYSFKVARYTPGCSPTYSSEVTVAVTGPTPIPTPTDTPISTPTPTRTPTPTNNPTPTRTPTPTKTPTPTTASTPTKTPTPTPGKAATLTSAKKSTSTSPDDALTSSPSPLVSSFLQPTVLGESIEATNSSPSKKPLIISLLFVSAGLAILAGYFVWQKKDAFRKKEDDILAS